MMFLYLMNKFIIKPYNYLKIKYFYGKKKLIQEAAVRPDLIKYKEIEFKIQLFYSNDCSQLVLHNHVWNCQEEEYTHLVQAIPPLGLSTHN